MSAARLVDARCPACDIPMAFRGSDGVTHTARVPNIGACPGCRTEVERVDGHGLDGVHWQRKADPGVPCKGCGSPLCRDSRCHVVPCDTCGAEVGGAEATDSTCGACVRDADR